MTRSLPVIMTIEKSDLPGTFSAISLIPSPTRPCSNSFEKKSVARYVYSVVS